MVDTRSVAEDHQRQLDNAVKHLHRKFEGVFGTETIRALLQDSYERIAARATVTSWLVATAQKFTQERLDALVRAEDRSRDKVPGVLFLCTHNAGRSQMALGWFAHLAGDLGVAWSGGSTPASDVNPVAAEAMLEVGIDIRREFPKPWTEEVLSAADIVVTMGCGDACPILPGKHYEDWEVADPAGQDLEVVRKIRDEIEHRVRGLLAQLEIAH